MPGSLRSEGLAPGGVSLAAHNFRCKPYPSEQDRGILGVARGNIGSWKSMRTKSTMQFWRCYG